MASLVAVRHKPRYSPPCLSRLSCDQAALFLLGHAWNGDEKAKEVLEQTADWLFPFPRY